MNDIAFFSQHIPLGTKYTHYKDPTKLYTTQNFVIDEATDEVMITYVAEYGAKLTFARHARTWIEEVEWNGEKVPRFRKA